MVARRYSAEWWPSRPSARRVSPGRRGMIGGWHAVAHDVRRTTTRTTQPRQETSMDDVLELGLDTFGDVTVDPDGVPAAAAAGDPRRRRRGRARRPGGRRLHRRRRAPPSRLRRIDARRRARGDRVADGADPARFGRDRALERRPDPGVPAVRDPRRGVERSCRGHPRAWLVHRVVPAVRLRPRPVRGSCSTRSSTCSPRCCPSSRSPGPAPSASRSSSSASTPRPATG